MPTSAGPNIIGENNLVLAYDTGDTVNSYKGEPTVNVLPSNKVLLTSYNDHGGSHTTDTSFTLFGNASLRNTSNPAQDWNGVYHTGLSSLLTPGVTYTYSFYIYFTSNNTTISYFGYGAPGYTGVKGQWNRVSTTFTATTQDYFYVTLQYSLGQPVTTYYLANIQIEANSHATQFINGTRSVTQGLLPIISNTSLDLSNVSFDSNAQITFDGTNDYIDVSSFSSLEIVDDVTIEAVIKANTSNLGSVKVIANKYSGTGWEFVLGSSGNFALGGRNGDGSYYSSDSGVVIADNTYHHIVGIKTGIYWKTYVDGALKSTTTAGSVGTLYNTTAMQLGREGSSYYTTMNLDVFKVYNRPLTSFEIQQNYQQYKSRFNLS